MENTRALVLIFSASNFIVGMGAFVVVGLLEPVAADLGLTPVRAGQLMTAYALGYAILSPLLVALTGRLGRRRVMFWALALFALAALLSAVAPGDEVLFAARVLAAAGAGMFTPVAAAVIAALTPEARRGKVLAQVFFGLTLAQVLGVPLGTWIGYGIGWRWAFALVAALALPCLWLIWTRVPQGLRFQPVSLSDLGAVLRDGRMMLAVSFTAVFLGGAYVLYTYFAPLMSGRMGLDGALISVALMIYGLGAVAGNLMGGWLTDRFGSERTLAGLTLAQVAIMPLFALLPIALWAFFALCLIWSVTGWSFMAAQQARLISRAPAQAPVTLALNAAAIYVGAALGSALGGAVLGAAGLVWLGPAAAVFTGLALITLRLAR